MKLRTLLIISSVILVAFTLGIGAFVVSASRRTDAIADQSTLAEQLIRRFFEQSTLAQEYIAHHDERPKTQWYLQHALMAKTLASPVLMREPSLTYLESLRAGVDGLKTAFDALVRQSESPSPNEELEKQLAGDMLVKSRAVTRIADDLATKTFAERAVMRDDADRKIFVLLAALVVLMMLILFVLYRRIIGALGKLQKGARIVGDGNLEYRIGGDRDDEIGQLSHAFDAMSAKLKTSYDTLEEKVEERTRELHVVSRRNEILLESIGDGVIAIDRFWNITQWNPATAKLTGWSEEEALGKPFRERVRFIREHDRKENLAFIEEAMLFGETKAMSNSTLLLTRDGREVPVGDSAAPIFDEAGTVSGVVIVFRDVTREKDASLLRTDFAYASHQLRTPVNKAMWNLEVILDDAKDPELLEKLQVAYRSIRDVQKLSSRLIDVSLIDQKQIVPTYEDVKVASILKDAIAPLKDAAQARKIEILLKPVAKDLLADTDAKLLRTALQELLDNAVLYSPAGGIVEVAVQTEQLDLVFHVKDRGVGISEEQKPLLFTKFFRGQNVPQDAPGAGLGLFIAREYVRLLGGKLWFESGLGAGTTFTISIPRVRGMKE